MSIAYIGDLSTLRVGSSVFGIIFCSSLKHLKRNIIQRTAGVLCDMGENCKGQRHRKLVATCQPSTDKIDNQDIYSLEFDGASKGNPGRAGAGAIIKRPDGTVLCQLTRGVGIATCNYAEYQALIMGLQAALDRGICHIKAQGDSKLVCSQVMGRWKVNSLNLSASFSEAVKLKERFQSFSIQHVYREFNSAADTLANTAVELPVDKPQIHCSSISPDLKETSKSHKGMKGARATESLSSLQDVSLKSTKLSSLSHEEKENFFCINYHGASNGEHAGAGAVLYSPDGTLHFEIKQGLGLATRNVAQYQALVIGLRAALECNVSHLEIQGDALLIFKQMTGTKKVKDERLQGLWREANNLLTRFSEFSITHVDKRQNSVACALAEFALQSPDGGSTNDDAKLVNTSNIKGRSNVGGFEALKFQTCAAEARTLNKTESSMESSVKSLHRAIYCPQVPMSCPGLFFPSYSHEASRVSRVKAQPLPFSAVMSKCLPLYAANTSMHKIALRCASKRMRVIPHIFQRSLMHIGMDKLVFSASISQGSPKRI